MTAACVKDGISSIARLVVGCLNTTKKMIDAVANRIMIFVVIDDRKRETM
jgi:hypothetical protein